MRGITTFIHCWWECEMAQLPWERVWHFNMLQMTFDMTQPICSHVATQEKQKHMSTHTHKERKASLSTNVGSIFHNSWKVGKIQMSINWCLDKQYKFGPHNEILISYRRKWSADICCKLDKSWITTSLMKDKITNAGTGIVVQKVKLYFWTFALHIRAPAQSWFLHFHLSFLLMYLGCKT